MIIADTSVWVHHLRSGDPDLEARLIVDEILAHPFIIGELALGTLNPRHAILALMGALPRAVVAEPDEVLRLIDGEGMSGAGIGYVDASLLASARLTPEAMLWTRDRRLDQLATRMGCAFAP